MESFRRFAKRICDIETRKLIDLLEEINLILFYMIYWDKENRLKKIESYLDTILENYNLIPYGEYKYLNDTDEKLNIDNVIYINIFYYKNKYLFKRKDK